MGKRVVKYTGRNLFLYSCCCFFHIHIWIEAGWHSGTVGNIVNSQVHGPWFNSKQVIVCVLPGYKWCSSVFSSFIPPPINMLVGRLTTLNCPQIWMSVQMHSHLGHIFYIVHSGPRIDHYPDQDKVVSKAEWMVCKLFHPALNMLLWDSWDILIANCASKI